MINARWEIGTDQEAWGFTLHFTACVGESQTSWLGINGRKDVQQRRKPLQLPSCSTQGAICFQEEIYNVGFFVLPQGCNSSLSGEDGVPQNEGWSKTTLDPEQQQHCWPVAPLVGQEMIAHTKEELWFWWSPTICSCTPYLVQLFLGITHLSTMPLLIGVISASPLRDCHSGNVSLHLFFDPSNYMALLLFLGEPTRQQFSLAHFCPILL